MPALPYSLGSIPLPFNREGYLLHETWFAYDAYHPAVTAAICAEFNFATAFFGFREPAIYQVAISSPSSLFSEPDNSSHGSPPLHLERGASGQQLRCANVAPRNDDYLQLYPLGYRMVGGFCCAICNR
ncbi:hypothetical protein B0H34DRAFT_709532 [Crassisporium funariophilum]|nr:hypothetical protein B0H34DRAFT_709532 [Crassisporium funariophilum]